MKRDRDKGAIAFLFGKHEAKKVASSATPSVVIEPQAVVIELQAEFTLENEYFLQFPDSPPPIDTEDQETPPPSPHLHSGTSADTHLPFECDPAKRIPISC